MPTYKFFDHDRFKWLVASLGIHRAQAFGHLALIERWLSDYHIDGDLTGIEDARIEFAADWDGERGRLVTCLRECGLLYDDDGRTMLRGWPENAPRYVHKRIKRLESLCEDGQDRVPNGGQRPETARNGGLEKSRVELSGVEKRVNTPPLTPPRGEPPPASWDYAKSCMSSDVLKTDRFQVAWGEWTSSRSKKLLTPLAVKKQIKRCEEMGHDAAIAAIDQSIANGWRGLFEPRNGSAKRVRCIDGRWYDLDDPDRPLRPGEKPSFDMEDDPNWRPKP